MFENVMHASYDYRKFAVLYVDDEEKSLKLFARAFGETFRVLTAPNAREGLHLLEETSNEIGILMTDQRMPGEKGVWLLEKARQLRPRVIRILVTAYTDMEAAIEAVNTGAIYRYVNKPWDPVQMEQTLKRGLEFFIVQRERDQLLREKMSVLHNMMMADRILSLGLLAAGLSHHIRNALQAVQTFLDLAPDKMQEEKTLLEGLRNPEFWKDYYDNVQRQIQKITMMLKELRSASDSSVQFLDEVNLREIVNQEISAMGPTFAERKLHIQNDVPNDLPVLRVDKAKLSRLFELLFKDEAVSLPSGSMVTISASTTPADGESASEIEIQVRDNGPGLPKDAVRLLFDPFVARSGSPMEYGINLMACYFIVHHHGGRIHADSEEGQGTTFTVRLPVDPAQAPPLQENPDFLRKLLLNEELWEKLSAE